MNAVGVFQLIGYFIIQCFQLSHVHRIGVFTACGDACDLAGNIIFSATDRESSYIGFPSF